MNPADKTQATQRTLVREMLTVQLAFAAVVGAIAIGAIYYLIQSGV